MSELDGEEERPRRGFWLHVGPAVLYVIAVFWGGSVGMAAMPGAELLTADKLLHALAFGGMHLVLLRAVRFELPHVAFGRQNLLALAATSALGGLLELHQMALPHRSAELYDWVADTLGALAVAGVVQLFARRACPSGQDEGA
jgi:hypothetical protein